MTDTKKTIKKEKWANFWYYYKYHILAAFAGVFVFLFLMSSLFTKDNVDLYVFYVTGDPVVFTEKVANITKAIKEYTTDQNNDGKTIVNVENIFIGEDHDAAAVHENRKKLMTIMRTGDCMFLVADEIGTEYLLEAGALADISDMASDMYYGGLAWPVNGSEFMQNEAMKDFKENLYMGLRVYKGTLAELLPSSQKNFIYSKEVLSRIIKNEKAEENKTEK